MDELTCIRCVRSYDLCEALESWIFDTELCACKFILELFRKLAELDHLTCSVPAF